ncbi:hypothetical protein Vadar_008316 [Vaccinium darrowii]|uniref:Uncharacterized protein n=1 Tax=Vaccinium darrowii TaxID=229202 RepID=A0ACB7YC97_9ERIC|nr:hypothetical protein Vadar_008316 [Vaccinium darrowii]
MVLVRRFGTPIGEVFEPRRDDKVGQFGTAIWAPIGEVSVRFGVLRLGWWDDHGCEHPGPNVKPPMVDMDLEAGVKVHLAKRERDCRICHLSFDAANLETGGLPMELGCSCKDDVAAAHKQCAEAWFKIKGNKYVLY